MTEKPENLRRTLFVRIVASIVLFGVFVAVAVGWVVTHTDVLQWIMFVPLVAAVFVLPSKLPQHFGEGLDNEAERALVRTGLWLSFVRLAYFLIAALVLLLLPRILH